MTREQDFEGIAEPKRRNMQPREFLIVPSLEAAFILILSLAGWVSHQPLVFASLGPTAFEIIETPDRPSARPYNIVCGNAVAIIAAFAALWVTNAWSSPDVSAQGVPLARVWAGTLAAMLTVLGTMLIRATQPAALSTSLLVSLGIMQTAKDAVVILVAVVLMVLIGEPIRRLRQRKP
jgi:CBS-domain-containing membrane protein